MATPVTSDVFRSPAVEILCALEQDGFRVEVTADGVLVIAPRSQLTPERMAAIAECKDAIRQLVRVCDPAVQARRSVFERQLAQTPAPRVPTFLFRPGISYQAGLCFSCGTRLPGLQFSRCWRCALAWRLACRLPVPAELASAIDAARVCA
jgi:hypothetical protein